MYFFYFYLIINKNCQTMKKIYMILTGLAFVVLAQSQPTTELWTKLAGESFPWFTTNGNVRSLDYSKTANKLLVSDMNNNIYILNPETGEQEGTLSRTGLGAEAFKHARIRVADDGAIYAIGFGGPPSPPLPTVCTLYRWANINANPTIATFFQPTYRIGDSFGISGSGNNTVIYISGSNLVNNQAVIIQLRSPNGIQFLTDAEIRVPSNGGQWSNRTVEPVSTGLGSDLWLKTTSGGPRRVSVGANESNVRTATLEFEPTDIPVGGFGAVRQFVTSNNKRFLAFAGSPLQSPSFQAAYMRIYDVTDESNVKLYAIDSLYTDIPNNIKANGNGTGDVAVREEPNGEFTIFYLTTNNGIRAVKTGLQILPVTMGKFEANMFNTAAKLNWTTVAENNNKGFNIEKSANGVDFTKIGFVASQAADGNSKLPLNYAFTDNAPGRGKVFYRLQQMDKDGKISYSDVKWVQAQQGATFTAFLRGNPIASEFSISINSSEKAKVNIALVNASGAVLQSHERNLDAGETIVNLPASQLPKGLYFVSIREASQPAKPITLKALK
jgi:hypothetical protein